MEGDLLLRVRSPQHRLCTYIVCYVSKPGETELPQECQNRNQHPEIT